MDSIFKILLAFITAIFITFAGSSVITGFSSSTSAENYFQGVSKTIVESNYNAEVINECIAQAQENGHTLKVSVGGSSIPGASKYAQVELQYHFELKLLNIAFNRKIERII